MGVYIKGLNIKPCEDGFDGKGLVIIGYDDKLYAVAHKQIIPLPDHGDLTDRDEAAHEIWLIRCEECGLDGWVCESCDNKTAMKKVMDAPVIIPAERSEE